MAAMIYGFSLGIIIIVLGELAPQPAGSIVLRRDATEEKLNHGAVTDGEWQTCRRARG